MNFEKYYKFDNGIYSVHFSNKAKLTKDEIWDIFSSYGKILRVKCNNDETGLRFVTYKSLQETINCLKGLKENNKIQILPEKSKIDGSNEYVDKRNLSQQQAARTENSFKKTFNGGMQANSTSICDENWSNIEESWTPIRTSNQNNEPDNYQNSMHDYKPDLNATKRKDLDSSVFNGKSSLPSRQQTSMEDNSSDITMDYAKYYRKLKDGTFNVHFSNKKGITIDKTRELFKPYGNVLSVYSGGFNNGLIFIRYGTEEEVTRCIKSFQNNTEIFILPQKNKMAEIKNTDKTNGQNLWQAEGASEKVFDAGKQFNSNSIHNEKFSEHEEKIISTSDWDKYGNTESFSDTGSCSSNQGWRFNANKIKHENTSSQMFNEKYSFLRQQNHISSEDYNGVMREKQQETKIHSSIKTETKTKLDRNMQVSTQDYKMPALISDIDIRLKESDTMSDSSLSSGNRNSSSKIVFIPMQEIIVANIHTNYGIHYILHLFEKHDPISATLVRMIPEINVRYCHVYFKSMQDAIAVEEKFDNFDLSGKNLIVLRKSRLIDKTM